jgi:8-oxo-dGTP pyrophosphatase MutT (NUDIX family)
VFRDDEVLVVRDPDEVHELPGGRREGGETLLGILQREVLEETGWTIDGVAAPGFIHFRHLEPEPPGFSYPYPEFAQAVYLSEVVDHVPDAVLSDGYDIESAFRPVAARELGLSAGGELFLAAALRVRGGHHAGNDARGPVL